MTPNPHRQELTEADIVRARIVLWESELLGREYEFVDGTRHVAPIEEQDKAILQALDERGLVEWPSE